MTKGSVRIKRPYRTSCNNVGLILSPCLGTMRSCSLVEGLSTGTSPLPEYWCPFIVISESELLTVCAESWFGARREMGLKVCVERWEV